MQTSSNYGLKLPEGTDNVKRQDFVDNFKLIDATMKSIDNKANYYGTTSGTNTYTTSIAGITAYTDGLKVTVKIGTTSTGTSTLNINELGEKTILDNLGNAITSGGLKAGIPYNLCYNGTNFIVLGKGGGGDALPEHVLINKKVTVDSGPIVGTMPNNTGTNKALGLNETWTIPKGYHDGNGKVTQDIPNNGAMNANLNCGQSKDISAGYISGGVITANSLASQTPANADASTIIAGRNAWVNGNLINGNASVQSLGGKKFATGSFGDIAIDTNVTASFGFRPSSIVGYSGSWAVLSYRVGSTAGGGLYSVRTAAVCATISLRDDGFLLYNTGGGGIIPGLTWYAYE